MPRPYLIVGPDNWVSLAAYAAGLSHVGRSAIWRAPGRMDLDQINPAAVVVDGMRIGRALRPLCRSRGIPLLVIDNGFLRRVHTASDNATGHFYLGLDGLAWAPAIAPDRTRFDALGLEIAQRQDLASRVALLAGQVPGDASHGFGSERLAIEYANLTASLQRAGWSVRFRWHPLGFQPPPPGAEPSPPALYSLREEIDQAGLIVTLNSNAGLDALMQGAPVATTMPSHYGRLAYRWPIARRFIRPPNADAVRVLCERLAWAQWTLKELQSGLPQHWMIEEGFAP